MIVDIHKRRDSLSGVLFDEGGCDLRLSPRIVEVREALGEAIPILLEEGFEVIIEKSPLCIAPSHIRFFNYEQGLMRYVLKKRPYWIFGRKELCGRCIVRGACYGIDPEYYDIYGDSELIPLAQVKSDSISVLTFDEFKSYEPVTYRTNVVAINDNKEKVRVEEFVKVLGRVDRKAKKRIAGVYILPYSCVK